jgi:hypothetical protein
MNPLLPFIGPSYNLDSRPASVQRTVNLIPVPLDPGNERTAWVFKDVPGLVELELIDPPVPGGTISFSSGVGTEPELPDGHIEGNGLVLFAVTGTGVTVTKGDADNWHLLATGAFSDSSAGVSSVRVYFSDSSEDVSFTISHGDANSWAVASISGITDPRFPDAFVEDEDFKRRTSLNLGAVSKAAAGHQVAIALGFIGVTTPGDAALTAPPTGYTELDTVSYTVGAMRREAMYAYKLFEGDDIDDDSFTDPDGGSYGGGGFGSFVVVITYDPT